YDGENEVLEKFDNLDTMLNLSLVEMGKLTDVITTMRIGELNEFIDQQQEKGSDMLAYFEVERQKRFSYPLATFILTIIGVSLSSRKVRGGTGLHIGLGIGLCFTYIMIARVAEEVAKGSGTMPGLLVWIPDFVFAIIAVVLYRKAPK
ncbi:MAG: LptF/LptG family permease, partial [Tidjanibacter sp.]|nr:LptF/LptG family permease [Tidjanibacter sp.]